MSLVENKPHRRSGKEPFMNAKQKEYFRKRLEAWKSSILHESKETINNLQQETTQHPDVADRASTESDWSLSCAPVIVSANSSQK